MKVTKIDREKVLHMHSPQEDAIGISTDSSEDSDSNSEDDDSYDSVASPEFYDFEKNRRADCFSIGQRWAIFDNLDGMPRSYARIDKVFKPFKVKLTWSKFVSGFGYEKSWKRRGLPVVCGEFKHDESDTIDDISLFSHKIVWDKGISTTTYKIYPRKGETWAVYKNWNIKWSCDTLINREYECELVVVLSDYASGVGVSVARLVKLKGFVCLFKQAKNNGMAPFRIPYNEMLRFSHRVPSYRTNDKERIVVPEGYFELDPASLPDNLEEVPDFIDGKAKIVDGKRNGSLKSVLKNPSTPKKRKISSSDCVTAVAKSSSKQILSCDRVPAVAKCISGQITSSTADHCELPEMASSPSSTIDPCELPETEFHIFYVDKTEDKFQVGQVWAVYCELDSMPKYCALIKRVESIPIFKLHIQWLETCTKPKGLLHWLDTKMPTCVGVFSGGDEAEFDETTSFSHLMKGAAAVQENRYEIFPRKGEVWAIYRNFSSEWSSDDLQTCEYDIGEVIEADGTIKVLVLEKVSDYKTVFKAQTKVGCESVLVIPHRQAIRFSHQIPAFQLTDEKEGTLRGCWELDPDGMPVCLFNSISSTLSKETSCADQACSKEIESDGVGSKPNILAKQSPHGPLHLDSCGFTKAQYSTLGEPQKRINSEKEHTMVGRRQLIEHTSSSRLADVYKEKRSEETSGLPLCKRKTATVSVGKKICDGPTVGSENTAKKISPHGVNTTIPVSVDEEIPSSPSPLKVFEKQETEFCNFDDERSCEKFKTGQVWALYCNLDEMPKNYALIESVESYPIFKLAVKWLKSCNPPRGVIPWVDKGMPVCCGIFKVVPGEGVVFNSTIAFSHQLSGVAAGNNLYTICPRVGEVWALYSKFCPDLTCADLKNCEYYMVEVLEVVDARWIIVSVLQSVTSFKTVFNAKGKEGLESFALAIPWVELYRFSHQVPGLKLTEARYGKLRGCWELDPRSMPVSIL